MSEQFNQIERTLAKRLEQFPAVKRTAKLIYQKINYLLFRKTYKYKSDYKLIEYGEVGKESFFGYYDKSPENTTKEYVIYQETEYSTHNLPTPTKEIVVVLFDIRNKEKIFTYKTSTYNWQQGTKLQWISDYSFIFNYCDINNNYGAIIVDAKSATIIKQISTPIYDATAKIVITLNFDRLNKYRPDYGYRNHENNTNDILPYNQDGVFSVDLESNQNKLIISIDRLLQNFPIDIPWTNNITHKVNHIMLSPKGDKFIFLHRYFIKGRKFDRLFLSDISGDNIELLSDHNMVSHCCWKGNDYILGFLRRFESGDGYYVIDLKKNQISLIENSLLNSYGDGHPSVVNGKMLFDTYPNKSRMKYIKMYDINTNKLESIGEFLESLKYYGETRCDLHPKWNMDGSKIFFDSVHNGIRKLYSISLEND